MTGFLFFAAFVLLLTVAAGLVRTGIGPGRADRMMSVQLVSTGGIGTVLLLSAATGNGAMVDVALVLALLAAFAAVAFVKASSPDGAGDPEEDEAR